MNSPARLLVNPILLINLGGEMVYILSQRLVAQKIDSIKATQVLTDILRSLFSQQLFTELMKPQKIMTMNFCQQLITKMVHCSIMKLNETSMSKLFDLMLMGFKAQIINCMHPSEIYDVTSNHFNGILNILHQGSSVEYLIQVQKKFEEVYSQMQPFDFIQIRVELLSFLQDIKQKVFVFIEDLTQNQNGDIRIVNSQMAGPFVGIPGQIVTLDHEGAAVSKVLKVLNCTDEFIQNPSTKFINNQTDWGSNLYLPNRKKRQLKISSHSTITTESSTIRKGFKNDQQMISELKLNSKIATQNLNSLANLIKGQEMPISKEENFTYNIFSKPTHNISAAKEVIGEDFFAEMITIDTKAGGKQNMEKQIASMFSGIDIKEEAHQEDNQDDDLLDMMDSLQDN